MTSSSKTLASAANVFEVLGIAANETINTRLLCYAFNAEPPFRTALLRKIAGPDVPQEIEAFAYNEVTVETPSGKRRIDLLIVARSASGLAIYVIENKISAGEGSEQTTDYASLIAQDSIRTELQSKHPDWRELIYHAEISFRYLVLHEADSPTSMEFKQLLHTDVAKSIKECSGKYRQSVVGQLLEGWASVVERFQRDATNISFDGPLASMLRSDEAAIDASYARFCTVAARLHGGISDRTGIEVRLSTYRSAAAGRSWYGAKYWCADWDTEGVKGVTIGRSIHFQLSVNPMDFSLTLALHYETNPYLPQGQARTAFEGDFARYRETRDAIVGGICEELAARGWSRAGSWNMVAKRRIADELIDGPSGRLLEQIADYLAEAVAIVDRVPDVRPH